MRTLYLVLWWVSVVLFSACAVGKPPDTDPPAKPPPEAYQGEWDITPRSTCKTTVSGKVYSPALKDPDPIYNVAVYTPRGPLDPLPKGVSCGKCSDFAVKAKTAALTGPDGSFTLEIDPSDKPLELVMQIGKWRRKVVLRNIVACVDNPLAKTLTRLPRDKSEGDIPQIAIATGDADPIQCLLRKMGISGEEFTHPWFDGRVHIFRHNGAGDETYPDGELLWDHPRHLSEYDIVMFPCEGGEVDKPLTGHKNVEDYLNIGGKVFATHYSYTWLYRSSALLPAVNWDFEKLFYPDEGIKVDMTFPKGAVFAQWLYDVGASPKVGNIYIGDPRRDVASVNPPTQRWVYSPGNESVLHFTFNTPVGVPAKDQCGRLVYSDFHVSLEYGTWSFGPSATGICNPEKAMTANEKALEFMLFDLSACVQPDDTAPRGPILK